MVSTRSGRQLAGKPSAAQARKTNDIMAAKVSRLDPSSNVTSSSYDEDNDDDEIYLLKSDDGDDDGIGFLKKKTTKKGQIKKPVAQKAGPAARSNKLGTTTKLVPTSCEKTTKANTIAPAKTATLEGNESKKLGKITKPVPTSIEKTAKTKTIAPSKTTTLEGNENKMLGRTTKPVPSSREKTPKTKTIAPSKTATLQGNESFEMSDDDDDSDDDIGRQLENVKSSKPRRRSLGNSSVSSSSSDSDSDESDRDNNQKKANNINSGSASKRRFGDRLARTQKKLKLQESYCVDDSDSDSDDDIQVVDASKKDNPIDGLSSDDEQPKKVSAMKGSDGFSKAKDRLIEAQSLHAEDDIDEQSEPEPDVVVLTSPDDLRNTTRTNVALTDATAKKGKQNLGTTIKITLRTNQEEDSFQIRMNESLQVLMDKYVAKQKIAKSKVGKVSFHFDGEQLDLKRTPTSCEMENEDMIDVVIKK